MSLTRIELEAISQFLEGGLRTVSKDPQVERYHSLSQISLIIHRQLDALNADSAVSQMSGQAKDGYDPWAGDALRKANKPYISWGEPHNYTSW